MATFTRLEVYQKIHAYPIIPLLSSNDVNESIQIINAAYTAGIRVFEFTNRGHLAYDIFCVLNKHVRENCSDMAFGIGTIIDAGTASLFIQQGADFIICPNLVEEVGKICNRRKIAWIPGAATVTEISKAEEMGAEIIKLFPAQVLGATFVKALQGPMPHSSIMATGGIEPTIACITEWFEAGVTCVGIGGKLFSKELFQSNNFIPLIETLSQSLNIACMIKEKTKKLK